MRAPVQGKQAERKVGHVLNHVAVSAKIHSEVVHRLDTLLPQSECLVQDI